MKLRKLNIKDTEDILKLHHQAFPVSPKWDKKGVHDLLKLKSTEGWGIMLRGDLKAILMVQKVLQEVEIITFVVKKSLIGQGIGYYLYTAVEENLRYQKIHSIFLEVAEDNLSAYQFYLRNGFQKIGIRPSYFLRTTGPSVNGISMNKGI